MLLRLLFILIFASSWAQQTRSKTFITWSEDYQATWADFQGVVDNGYLLAAMTSYKIDLQPETVMVDENDQIQGYENLTVIANFYKKTSWHSTNSDHILKHERLHFDIAELFSRKIRKRFSELENRKQATFSVYQEVFTLFWKECRMMQKQYD
ncbi:MAG: hypothetical protein JKY22_01305 [Flavobacteriaceae bacterium]|nr:hypothetical protein [Flavobacteriaceae bacterium]